MPKLRVALGYGALGDAWASIESDDGCMDLGRAVTPRAACRAAARALRIAALRFEMLADEAEPYHEKTHRRVNRAAVST